MDLCFRRWSGWRNGPQGQTRAVLILAPYRDNNAPAQVVISWLWWKDSYGERFDGSQSGPDLVLISIDASSCARRMPASKFYRALSFLACFRVHDAQKT